MAAAGETGGLGYFKGVMLCARPVERNVRPERASFCATVTGRAELGVDPSHKLKPRRERKRVVTAIVNHRKWLEQLKSEMDSKKQRTVQEMLQEELRRMKVKEKSQQARELIRKDQSMLIKSQIYPMFQPGEASQAARSHSEKVVPRDLIVGANSMHSPNQLRSSTSNKQREVLEDRLKDQRDMEQDHQHLAKTLPKPSQTASPALHPGGQDLAATKKPSKQKLSEWSKAAASAETELDEEVGSLISFMEQFDAEKYAEDVETRALMNSLKERVDKLKQEPDWREKWEERIKEKRRKREEEYKKQKEAQEEDNRSVVGNDSQLGIGGASIGSKGESKSIQSERTQGRLLTNDRSYTSTQRES